MVTTQDSRSGEHIDQSYPLRDLETGRENLPVPTNSSSSSISTTSPPPETAHLNITKELQANRTSPQSARSLQTLVRLTQPFIRTYRRCILWLKGPVPPRPYHIIPILGRVQTAPLSLIDRFAPNFRHKFLLLFAYYLLWLSLFVSIIHKSNSTGTNTKFGEPVKLSCISKLW
jgi:hypothetical protein